MNVKGPIYKPEFWDKVQELDMWTNKYDPIMTCQPMGIPRQGEPRRIFHTVDDITMFYTYSDYGGGNREYRMIPTNGGSTMRIRRDRQPILGTASESGRATRS
jgi:hypothetical protein